MSRLSPSDLQNRAWDETILPACQTAATELQHESAYGTAQPGRVGTIRRAIRHVGVEIEVSTTKPNRILADKPRESGKVVPRPRVAPDARSPCTSAFS